jgi:CPA2 family monovalent cation:H+ antiporter-2
VIVASLVTTAVGLSPILGALIAGILIAETDYHNEVGVVTAPFKGLALGVFLISVGMSLDLHSSTPICRCCCLPLRASLWSRRS